MEAGCIQKSDDCDDWAKKVCENNSLQGSTYQCSGAVRERYQAMEEEEISRWKLKFESVKQSVKH